MFGGEIDRYFIKLNESGVYEFTVVDNRLNATFQVCNSNETQTYSTIGYQLTGSFNTNFSAGTMILFKGIQSNKYSYITPHYGVEIHKK